MAAPDLRTAVRSGAAHLDEMAAELAALEHAGRAGETVYAELQHRFDALGGYTLDQRVDAALTGLGFSRGEWAKPPSAMSGGEQTRASLARLVIADPDLLLLDEPTNHLDIDALEWLEAHLQRRSGSLLVASHDRAFLDATVTRVWELRDRRLTPFRGNYSAYHRQRVERDERATKEAGTHAEQIARERELVQRYRSHRKFSKMHEHEARLEKLQEEQRAVPQGLPPARPAGPGARRRYPEPLGRDRRPRRGGRGRLPPGTWRARRRRPARIRADRGGPCPVPRRPARRAHRDRRSERCRQDHAAAHDCRGVAATRRGHHVRPQHPARAISRSSAAARSRERRSSMRCSRRSRSRPARRAAIWRASCSAVTTCSRRSACCRAASGRASSWHCSASRHRTCCSSTSRPTTWISRPVRRSRGSSSSRRRPC